MENQQMAMPAEMAAAGPGPDQMAIYEQMRQGISPQEFSNEMLASASQIDPQAVAEFTEELRSLDVSPEELDALNDLVDEILANPEQYEEIRQKYLAQGLPEDILPEQFDPNFFAAMNMAVDQMIAAPTGVQAFAEGGIAELKPIAKAIASYGRNGDTMLAHITPAEARMLRRRGGSGTINPHTGLPEFFLKKAFKSIGKAVKKFTSSTVGRIVTTIALGFFLGPAAASFLGATSVAGVAAVSGFVGSAGSTLLGGGNLKDALKAGAVGGLTAGAGAGIMGGADAFASGSYTGATTVGGQFDKFKSAITPGVPVAPTPGLDATGQAPVPGQYSDLKLTGAPRTPFPEFFGDQASAATTGAPASGAQFGVGDPGAGFEPGLTQPPVSTPKPGMFDSTKKFISDNISPSGIREGAIPGAQQAAANAVAAAEKTIPASITGEARAAMLKTTYDNALKGAMPGTLATYGPMAAVGLGTMAAFGGFDTKPVQGGPITNSLMKPVTQRIREGGTQRQMYMQGLPGVVYDDMGAPVFGQSTRLPTYDVPDYNSGGFDMSGQGTMNLPQVYTPPSTYTSPSGTIGSRRVEQPYNNSDMYSNIMPRRYDDGGEVTPVAPRTTRTAGLPANFNWEQYVAANPDLGRAGIDTREAAQTHFLNNGRKENRALNPEEAAQRETARVTTLAEQKAARDRVAQDKAMRRAGGSGQMYANINAGIAALAPETNPMNSSDTGFGARNRGLRMESLEQTYGTMLQKQRDARALQERILTKDPTLTGGDSPITTNPVTRPVTAPPTTGPVTTPTTTTTIQTRTANNVPVTPPGDFGHFGIDEYGRGAGEGFGTAPPPGMQPIYQAAPGAITPPTTTTMPAYFTQNPDVAASYRQNSYGMTPEQFAQTHFERYGQNEQRAAPGATTTMPVTTTPLTQTGGRPDPGPGAFYHYVPPTAGATDYSALTPAQIANAPGMGIGGIGLTALPGLTALNAPSMGVGGFGLTAAPGLTAYMNQGGIAGLAQGGYPRRTGQISGPGTEKSDSIPAMLSDGEFVMTAKAVRGAGKGSRRAGAKQMYKLMHQLEKNSERG